MPEWVTNPGRCSPHLQALLCSGLSYLLVSKVRESLRSDGDRDLKYLIPSAPLASQKQTSWPPSGNSQVTVGQWKCHIDFCLWLYHSNLLLFHEFSLFFSSLFSSQFSFLKCFSFPAGIPLPSTQSSPPFNDSPPHPPSLLMHSKLMIMTSTTIISSCLRMHSQNTECFSPEISQVFSQGPPSWSLSGWATGKQVGERGWYSVRLPLEALCCQSFWHRDVWCNLMHCGSWGLHGSCALCQSQYGFQRKLSNSVCEREKKWKFNDSTWCFL